MSAQLDPYEEFGPADEDYSWMSDPDKLRLLADWFDLQDELRGTDGPPEVQDDLRRMAHDMELENELGNEWMFFLLLGTVFLLFVLLLTSL